MTPQPGRHAFFGDRRKARRHPRLTEVLLGEDVGGDLAPLRRYLDPLGLEDDGAVGIADLASGRPERNRRVRVLPRRRKLTCDMHSRPRFVSATALFPPGGSPID